MKEEGIFYFFSLIQSFFFSTLWWEFCLPRKNKCEMWMQWLRKWRFFFYCWDFSIKNDLAAIYFPIRGQCFWKDLVCFWGKKKADFKPKTGQMMSYTWSLNFRQEKWVINQRRIIWPGGMCLIGQNVWMMPSLMPYPSTKAGKQGW